MLEPKRVLGYLADSMRLGSGPAVSLDASVQQWRIPYDVVRDGRLGIALTREIMESYTAQHPDVSFGERGIPLAFSLRTMVDADGQGMDPLLVLPGLLDASGQVVVSPGDAPWIPYRHMAHAALKSDVATVCDLDAYRAHQAALASLGGVFTWPVAVERAIDLFDAVMAMDGDALAASGCRIDDDMCYVRVWEHPDDARAVSHVLTSFADELAEGGVEVLSGPLRLMLGEDRKTLPGPAPERTLGDDALLAYKMRCGIVDFAEPLAPTERLALNDCVRQEQGDVVAIEAPAGTGAASLAACAMANMLTERVLRGEAAPAMACVGDPVELRELLDLYQQRPTAGHTALPSRWLPRIAREDAPASSAHERKVLGPLASPFLVHASDGASVEPRPAWPTQSYAHQQDAAAARYSSTWYVSQATIYYLDCVSSFVGERLRSTQDAAALLAERLRRVDQDRCELIDAYADVCRADELVRRRDDIVAQLVVLRKDHKTCRERMLVWERVAAKHPLRTIRLGGATPNQRSIIQRAALPGEGLVEGCATVDEVRARYRGEIDRIEGEIDRLRAASTTLTRRARLVAPESGRCAELISRLSTLCRLSSEQRMLLETTIDGRQVSLGYLDAMLDRTVRSSEFWLAVHVCEAQWLGSCTESTATLRTIRDGGHGAWATWANFCPFGLVPTTLAVDAVQRHTGGEHGTPKSRLDLLVILDADRTDVATGAALLGMANQVVAMGAQGSLGPDGPNGAIYDKLTGQAQFTAEGWQELCGRQLSVSGGTSLHKSLMRLDGVRKSAIAELREPYAELCDARASLFATQELRTLRRPAYGAEDERYALDDLLPVLSYVLVPDSAWAQLGGSKENRSEALAMFRWLGNHGEDLRVRFPRHGQPSVCLLAPYEAQAALLRKTLKDRLGTDGLADNLLEVRTLCDAGRRTWPLVLFCGTCGPDTLQGDCGTGFSGVLDLALSHASDALVLFCGGSWLRTSDPVAAALMRRLVRVGRLFSVPRTRRTPAGETASTTDRAESTPKELREKALSLTVLLQRMERRGDIASAPSAAEVNRALSQAGLIERATDGAGRPGWRPTAAGREIGIEGTKDRNGHLFCAYGRSAEAVVASIVGTLGRRQE